MIKYKAIIRTTDKDLYKVLKEVTRDTARDGWSLSPPDDNTAVYSVYFISKADASIIFRALLDNAESSVNKCITSSSRRIWLQYLLTNIELVDIETSDCIDFNSILEDEQIHSNS